MKCSNVIPAIKETGFVTERNESLKTKLEQLLGIKLFCSEAPSEAPKGCNHMRQLATRAVSRSCEIKLRKHAPDTPRSNDHFETILKLSLCSLRSSENWNIIQTFQGLSSTEPKYHLPWKQRSNLGVVSRTFQIAGQFSHL